METIQHHMIPYNDARSIIEELPVQAGRETIGLSDALDRVLAENVVADMNMPPFDKSAMDGFACRRADLAGDLLVIGTIAAGQHSDLTVSGGQCVRIMTGARVPEGADCVIKFEDTEPAGENRIRFRAQKTSNNICYLGEDVKTGEILVPGGTMLNPGHLAVLAGMGYARPKVYTRPPTGIFVTGNELVGTDKTPSDTQIRNSNGPQLEAQCRAMNIYPKNYGIIPDDREALTGALKTSINDNTVTIISGGVSVGDYDYVPELITAEGFTIHFHGMKVKPGKRMLFASREDKYIFGLPGNPVSSFIQFEMLIRPFLLRLQGANQLPGMDSFTLGSDYKVKNTERTAFVPVNINREGVAFPVEYHGSAHIFAFTGANGFMEIPEGISYLTKGQKINARRL